MGVPNLILAPDAI